MSLQIKKHKDRFYCPLFLEYVRTLGCEDCRVLGLTQLYRTTASHLISVKWAEGSDALAIPQCLEHHPQSSKQAESLLVSKGVDMLTLHRRLWNGFLLEKGIATSKILTQQQFEQKMMVLGFCVDTYSRRKNR